MLEIKMGGAWKEWLEADWKVPACLSPGFSLLSLNLGDWLTISKRKLSVDFGIFSAGSSISEALPLSRLKRKCSPLGKDRLSLSEDDYCVLRKVWI